MEHLAQGARVHGGAADVEDVRHLREARPPLGRGLLDGQHERTHRRVDEHRGRGIEVEAAADQGEDRLLGKTVRAPP